MADSQDSLKAFVKERGGVATGAVYRVTLMRRTVRLRRTAEWKVEVGIPLLSALRHIDCGPDDTVDDPNWVTGDLEFDARLRVRGDPLRCWGALHPSGIGATLDLLEDDAAFVRDGRLTLRVGSPYVVEDTVARVIAKDEAFPAPRDAELDELTHQLLTTVDRRIRAQLEAVIDAVFPLPAHSEVRLHARFDVASGMGDAGVPELAAMLGQAGPALQRPLITRLLEHYESQPTSANAVAAIAQDRLDRDLPIDLRIRALRMLSEQDAENAGRTAVSILTDRRSPAPLWLEAFEVSAARKGLLPMGAIGNRLGDDDLRDALVDRLVGCARQDTLNLVVQFMQGNPSLAEALAEQTVANVSAALELDGYLTIALEHIDKEAPLLRALELARDYGTSALISAVRAHASGFFRDRDVKNAANAALFELRARAGGEAGALAIAASGGELSELDRGGRLSTKETDRSG